MNNFEQLKECRSISEMASILAFTDLAEILEVEQPIPDEHFYKEWLGRKVKKGTKNKYKKKIIKKKNN